MDESRGFQYQLVGVKHSTMLAVSLYSLRRYHTEPIQIVCGDLDALGAVHEITKDPLLAPIDWKVWEAPKEGGKGQQHANKATGVEFSPFDKTIFLDADTTVHANLTELWPKTDEVHLTRFADWVTTGGMMRGRLQAWHKVRPERVELMKVVPYPAINTGVFSFASTSTEYLADWKATTNANPIFMADELAAQLIFPDHKHVINSDRWNYSPRYSVPNDKAIRIRHYHGFQHARPNKSDGWKTWCDLYHQCYAENRCGVRDLPHDKHLRLWLQENPDFMKMGATSGT